MTNFENELQNLTIDKYAWMIFDNKGCNCVRCPVYKHCKEFASGLDCRKKIKHWLESEVTHNE